MIMPHFSVRSGGAGYSGGYIDLISDFDSYREGISISDLFKILIEFD